MVMQALWALTSGERARYAAAIVAMGVGTVFLLMVPYVLKYALDALIHGNANLTWTLPASTTGAGFGAAGNKTITLAPSVTQANFQNATVGGPYTNTVTIAVTP